MLHVPRRAIGAAMTGAVAIALVATSVAPAQADDHLNLPGEPTLTLPINDSEAGGTYEQDFTQAYAGGHPRRDARVHLRARGHPARRQRAHGRREPRPRLRPDARRRVRAVRRLQRRGLHDHAGADRLHGRPARQPDRRGRRGALRPHGCGRPRRAGERLARHGGLQRAGRAVLRLLPDELHRGVLRTRVHRLVRHEHDRHRRVRLGEPGGTGRLRVERRRPRQRPADPVRGRDRP